MSALRWAAVPVVVGALGANVPSAAADELPPAAAITPALAPALTPTPIPDPTPVPTPPPIIAGGAVIYVTTITTTTTIVNAPITVIAAPITMTINNDTTSSSTTSNASTNNSASSNSTDSNSSGTASGAVPRERFVIDLTGCRRPRGGSATAVRESVRRAKVRLAPTAILVVRVNGRRVTTLSLPASRRRVALRLRLFRSGKLSIRRPSGRVLSVQGCTPA